ncbi:hypothetical protein IFO70_34780 [Phormidium tenue FACHB-886]|nr:hypothetical protein [Phormidium tenue FACHB-886]
MTFTPQQKYQTTSKKPIATGVIVHDAVPQQKQPNPSWLSRTWNYLMHHLLQGNEPRVWQKHNAAGEVFYYGYDPYSGQTTHLTSDIDLRAWLEQLPYQ